MRFDWKLFLLVVVFIVCIAPTIICYDPYSFRWDDSDYLMRSMTVSNAVWSGNRHELVAEIRSNPRPPILTLLGIPWGPLTSWGAVRYTSLCDLIHGGLSFCLDCFRRNTSNPV